MVYAGRGTGVAHWGMSIQTGTFTFHSRSRANTIHSARTSNI